MKKEITKEDRVLRMEQYRYAGYRIAWHLARSKDSLFWKGRLFVFPKEMVGKHTMGKPTRCILEVHSIIYQTYKACAYITYNGIILKMFTRSEQQAISVAENIAVNLHKENMGHGKGETYGTRL